MSSSYNRGWRIGNQAHTKEMKSATERSMIGIAGTQKIVILSPGDWKDDDTWVETANTDLLGKQ